MKFVLAGNLAVNTAHIVSVLLDEDQKEAWVFLSASKSPHGPGPLVIALDGEGTLQKQFHEILLLLSSETPSVERGWTTATPAKNDNA